MPASCRAAHNLDFPLVPAIGFGPHQYVLELRRSKAILQECSDQRRVQSARTQLCENVVVIRDEQSMVRINICERDRGAIINRFVATPGENENLGLDSVPCRNVETRRWYLSLP